MVEAVVKAVVEPVVEAVVEGFFTLCSISDREVDGRLTMLMERLRVGGSLGVGGGLLLTSLVS